MSLTTGVKVMEFLSDKGVLTSLNPGWKQQLANEIDEMLGYPDSKVPFDEVVTKVAALAAQASPAPEREAPESARAELVGRIHYYLLNGGLWNPEMADHYEVSKLLRDCRDYLQSAAACSGRGEGAE